MVHCHDGLCCNGAHVMVDCAVMVHCHGGLCCNGALSWWTVL